MHRILQDSLWLAPAALECAIAISMFRRNLHREYPVFWSYLILATLRTVLLYSIGNDRAHYARYFSTFWKTEIVASLLDLFVVAEIFGQAFSMRLGLQRYGTALFRFSLMALLATAPLIAFLWPGRDSSQLIAAIVTLKRAESLVQAGLDRK